MLAKNISCTAQQIVSFFYLLIIQSNIMEKKKVMSSLWFFWFIKLEIPTNHLQGIYITLISVYDYLLWILEKDNKK